MQIFLHFRILMTKKHEESSSTPRIWCQGVGNKCRIYHGSIFSDLSVTFPDPKWPAGRGSSWGDQGALAQLILGFSSNEVSGGSFVISPRLARTSSQCKSLDTVQGRITRILCQWDGIPLSTWHFMTTNIYLIPFYMMVSARRFAMHRTQCSP